MLRHHFSKDHHSLETSKLLDANTLLGDGQRAELVVEPAGEVGCMTAEGNGSSARAGGALEAGRCLGTGTDHAIGLAGAADVRDIARAVMGMEVGRMFAGAVLGGADADEE